jgi:hypothetical protein
MAAVLRAEAKGPSAVNHLAVDTTDPQVDEIVEERIMDADNRIVSVERYAKGKLLGKVFSG